MTDIIPPTAPSADADADALLQTATAQAFDTLALPAGMLAGACGLGTVALLDGDVTDRQLIAENGEIEVRRAILEPALLEQHAAEPERERWWRERIARCHRLLANS